MGQVRKSEAYAEDFIRNHLDEAGVYDPEAFYEIKGSELKTALAAAHLHVDQSDSCIERGPGGQCEGGGQKRSGEGVASVTRHLS